MAEYIIQETTLKSIAEQVKRLRYMSINDRVTPEQMISLLSDIYPLMDYFKNPYRYRVVDYTGITTLYSHCFSYNTYIQEVIAPDVEYINANAFRGCTNLTSFQIPPTFKGDSGYSGCRIPDRVFYECSSLSAIEIPEGITGIGNETFYDSGIEVINLPESLEYVGFNSFTMSNLKTLVVNSSAALLTESFSYCYSLTDITFNKASCSMYTDAFYECYPITNITIAEGWTESIYFNWSKQITQESLHGMIENLADLTGLDAKEFMVGATNIAKIDDEHITMLEVKNWNYS